MVVSAAPPALNLGLFLSHDEVDVPLGTAGRHDADRVLVGVSACDCLPFDGHGTVGKSNCQSAVIPRVVGRW